jgi:hypothetical protein
MPEQNKYNYIKVAKKGYLYNNEDKQEGSPAPDVKGRIVELELKKLEPYADEEGKVTVALAGWREQDQEGTDRLGLQCQYVEKQGEAPAESKPASNSPF